jgi:voltage-gated potassium channel
MSSIRHKIILAVSLFILLLFIGVVGYHFISGFSWIDSIYMTVITATTVGFGEVQPLDDTGKIFTVILILFSIGIYGYGVSILSEFLLNNQIFENIINKRMENKINSFKNHIILAGFGRVGKTVYDKLAKYNKQVVVIEKEDIDSSKYNSKYVIFIEDDATKDEILLKAGIMNASTLIITLGEDADNLFIVLSARQLNPKIEIISRAANEVVKRKLKLAGADQIILPYKIGGEYMASLLLSPDLVEFMQHLSLEDRNVKTNLEEISFDDCPVEYHDKSIAELNLRKLTGCTVIGYKSPVGDYIINPNPNTKIVKGSNIIVLGQIEQIKKLNELFNIS